MSELQFLVVWLISFDCRLATFTESYLTRVSFLSLCLPTLLSRDLTLTDLSLSLSAKLLTSRSRFYLLFKN